MNTFLSLASLMALTVAWLLIWPVLNAHFERKEKQKTCFFILFTTVIFPLLFYLFIAR